ncbi:jg19707 [Pararge aegeria aegeria]|uniref:Jg19707 protein n=1 Tax=Pararge aegeria aegeria TaxID=348720 RepID=A0A8S4R4A7_9NEOP|nr:jg19707 [Pararge aegeria aegeria]
MVFCYKIITESPSRSRCVSPRKASPVGRFPLQNTVSSLVASFDYETDKGDIWDAIPDRDWRLLAALARKREEDIERERLAEQFQKMWLKEKEEREMVETESSEQYKKYLCKKRCREQSYHEYKRMMRKAEQHAKTGQLVSCIRHKEQRAADMLAWRENRKRLAITNALSSWETSLIRQEAEAVEAAKRATFAAHNALKDARSVRISKIKDSRTLRARQLAALTAQMREAVRMAT